MELINKHIEQYLLESIPERDEILSAMEELGKQNNFPIVGPLVGRLLFQLTKLTNAKRILELGSGFGYSAMWFLSALNTEGNIICTDTSSHNHTMAEGFFRQAKLWHRIDFRIGNALELIDKLDGEFDIIFNDIDKADYPEAFRKAIPKLRKGGLLISDNVLWSGKILDHFPDESTAGVLTYNRLIYTSQELYTTIIPLRDGVSVSIKL